MRNKIRIKPDSKVNDLQAASMVLCADLKKGFTLIELMAVIAIAGILATIAVPAFQEWMTHSAVNNATATVVSKLKQARNIAVAENRNITLSFDSVANTFTYDVYAYAPKVSEKIDLKQFSKTLTFRKNRAATLVFTSLGTIQGQVTTMKLLKGNYYQCITVNLIGRSYVSTMASASATCQGL
ncbi:MAG: prepilin-type N-terminal cleavage/methylation domain-containing protein [Mariprofundaceae bacterium]|nr:prepilin-type N-terminal cleavage/methylation domain-containing protein [Mariprofundaceae bacterium]